MSDKFNVGDKVRIIPSEHEYSITVDGTEGEVIEYCPDFDKGDAAVYFKVTKMGPGGDNDFLGDKFWVMVDAIELIRGQSDFAKTFIGTFVGKDEMWTAVEELSKP